MIQPRSLLVVVLLAALSNGCFTSQIGHYSDPGEIRRQKADAKKAAIDARMKAAVDGYVACAYSAADTLVSGPGTPTEIAEAAAGECGRHLAAFRAAAQEFLTARLSRDSRYDVAANAEAQTIGLRDDVRRAIIGRVLHARDPK